MGEVSLGVLARSSKHAERRLPIHPLHFERIDTDLLGRIYVETGYGDRFGVSDERLRRHVAGVRSRDQLIAECDIILLVTPLAVDLAGLRPGQAVWGWSRCIQDENLTQLAIDRRLTLIEFGAMHYWTADGSFNLHVFHKDGELAGYCSVLHALAIAGLTGDYGRRLRAAVVGFGAAARGAVTALNAHGVHDVNILTNRGVTAVGSPTHSMSMVQFEPDSDDTDPRHCRVVTPDEASLGYDSIPLAEFFAKADIIVNCVTQDIDAPLTFLTEDDLHLLVPGSVIVDISCDVGMGFSWAGPITSTQPAAMVGGNNILYYAMEHSSSYFWDSASWEISEALLPYLRDVLAGPSSWDLNETIRRAIEIRDGTVEDSKILSFQNRLPLYPHSFRRSDE